MKIDALAARFAHILLRKKVLGALGLHKSDFYYVDEQHDRPDVRVLERFTANPKSIPPVSNSHWAYKPSDSKFTFEVDNAYVDAATGLIYTEDRQLLGDFSSYHFLYLLFDLPRPLSWGKKLPDTSKYLFLGANGFYHWLIEDVPAYLQARGTAPDAQTLVRTRSPKYVYDLLNILGITPIEVASTVQAPTLALTSKGSALFANPHDVATLRKFAKRIESKPDLPKKIYISRRDAARFPDNEDAVERLIKEKGLEIVRLTGMDITQQIQLFRNATVIVGPHGAGLTNIVWSAPKKASLIEIANRPNPRCFEWLADVCGIKYERLEHSSMTTAEWNVDLVTLGGAIDRVLAK